MIQKGGHAFKTFFQLRYIGTFKINVKKLGRIFLGRKKQMGNANPFIDVSKVHTKFHNCHFMFLQKIAQHTTACISF